MNIEEIREYCLAKKEVTESFPFNDTALVFKVLDKMFALLNLIETPSINLKCDPQRAIELREKYTAIQPGYHMNKKHWNTVDLQETIPDHLLLELIDHSYDIVVKKLTRKQQEVLNT